MRGELLNEELKIFCLFVYLVVKWLCGGDDDEGVERETIGPLNNLHFSLLHN